MAKFLDERPAEDDNSITESFEETLQFQEEVNSVPEKYQNKSIEELVQMHQEAEKLVGKQSSEVGELRRVVDEYIHQQTQLTQQKNEPVEEIDFFSEPDRAVSNAIENHPSVREAKQVAQEYRKTTALSQLQSKHPEMNTILQDEKFLEWIKGSNVRTRLLQQADQQFDVEAADELFSTWKERQQMIGTTADAEKSQRKQQVKAASTGSSSGSGEKASRKIYRRADIINLMRTDPARYQALSDEILKAYAEGRVKS
jgi:DNA-directed RNA polymerase subunit F